MNVRNGAFTITPDTHFTGIDDRGRIFGDGGLSSELGGAPNFVLIPVPEPGSPVLLLTSIGAVATVSRRRGTRA